MGPKPRQVFITQSQVLATRVAEYFGKLMSSLEAAVSSPKELHTIAKDAEQEVEFIDQDDNQPWESNLPEKFSELLDDHFPLFITYNQVWTFSVSECLILLPCQQLCTLLQNDCGGDDDNDGKTIPKIYQR